MKTTVLENIKLNDIYFSQPNKKKKKKKKKEIKQPHKQLPEKLNTLKELKTTS